MIRAIIVEDEFYPRETLIMQLKENHADIEVLTACENAESALIEILRRQPDLIFLDIQLPDKNGLWIAEELHKMACEKFTPPGIIFTTAFTDSDYLLSAFKVAALDYLVKPIMPDSLAKAIDRFKNLGQQHLNGGSLMSAFQKEKILKFKNYGGLLLLKPENIAYVKADGKYAQIFLANGEMEDIFDSIAEIENTLSSTLFFRAGRSLIINRQYIRRLNVKKSLVQITTPTASYDLKIPEKSVKELKEDLEGKGD
ncbi:DNA-binding response regulator [Bacteroidia bacterium]|nr:DNA-binding response regulator [Bacteroidia bacterium]